MNFLQKEQERYSKEKTAEYYLKNKEAIKEKSKNQYRSLSKKKTRLKSIKKQIPEINSVEKQGITK